MSSAAVSSRHQSVRSIGRIVATSGFTALGVLHVAWGRGSSFPFPDREQLADAVVGRRAVPDAAACHGVAGCLFAAAALAADPRIGPRNMRAIGRMGVVAVLTARGVLGLLGRTDMVSPGSSGQRFRRLDRRVFSPLCLALALATAAVGVRRERGDSA